MERKEVWTEVGLVLEHLNRLEEAEKVYDKALELDPIGRSALEGLYRVLKQEGKSAELIDCSSRLIAIKEDLSIFKTKIDALIKLGRFQEALDATNGALQRWPSDPELMSKKRDTIMALGMNNEAIKNCEEILAQHPNDPETMYDLGLAYLRVMRYQEAIKTFEKDLKYHADKEKVWLGIKDSI